MLRFDQGRWVAIDNGSLNGMYVNGRRVPAVDIQDGQRVNIGNPDGPQLSFEVGRHRAPRARPPQTTSVPVAIAPRHSMADPATAATDYNAPAEHLSPAAADVPVRTPAALPVGSAGLTEWPAVLPERPAAYASSPSQPVRRPRRRNSRSRRPASSR